MPGRSSMHGKEANGVWGVIYIKVAGFLEGSAMLTEAMAACMALLGGHADGGVQVRLSVTEALSGSFIPTVLSAIQCTCPVNGNGVWLLMVMWLKNNDWLFSIVRVARDKMDC